jgi:hypothetical protein
MIPTNATARSMAAMLFGLRNVWSTQTKTTANATNGMRMPVSGILSSLRRDFIGCRPYRH